MGDSASLVPDEQAARTETVSTAMHHNATRGYFTVLRFFVLSNDFVGSFVSRFMAGNGRVGSTPYNIEVYRSVSLDHAAASRSLLLHTKLLHTKFAYGTPDGVNWHSVYRGTSLSKMLPGPYDAEAASVR
jgi:hypothetical protein